MKSTKVELESLGDKLTAKFFMPEGEGPYSAVIFVHGAFDYKENFFELADYFCQRGVAALAIDMHGHGESEGARYHVRMAQWVPDLSAAIDFLSTMPHVDCSRIGAFGFSSGGTAVLEAAVVDARLKALVTLDATVQPIVSLFEQGAFKLLGWFGEKRRERSGKDIYLPLYKAASRFPVACDPNVSEKFINDPYLVKGYSRYPIPGAVESLVVNTLSKVDQITAPVCVIHGQEDQIDKPSSAKKLFKRLMCKKSLHIIPDSGHVGHMDRQKWQVMEIAFSWFSETL